jgi:hypothetical protein
MMAVVALILELCMKKAKALNKMISRHSSFTEIILFNAFAFFIHKSKLRATNAKIQITLLLVKLECFEIIKACDLNYGSGCSNLGVMHEKGKGVKQDDLKALKLKSKIRATIAII